MRAALTSRRRSATPVSAIGPGLGCSSRLRCGHCVGRCERVAEHRRAAAGEVDAEVRRVRRRARARRRGRHQQVERRLPLCEGRSAAGPGRPGRDVPRRGEDALVEGRYDGKVEIESARRLHLRGELHGPGIGGQGPGDDPAVGERRDAGAGHRAGRPGEPQRPRDAQRHRLRCRPTSRRRHRQPARKGGAGRRQPWPRRCLREPQRRVEGSGEHGRVRIGAGGELGRLERCGSRAVTCTVPAPGIGRRPERLWPLAAVERDRDAEREPQLLEAGVQGQPRPELAVARCEALVDHRAELRVGRIRADDERHRGPRWTAFADDVVADLGQEQPLLDQHAARPPVAAQADQDGLVVDDRPGHRGLLAALRQRTHGRVADQRQLLGERGAGRRQLDRGVGVRRSGDNDYGEECTCDRGDPSHIGRLEASA